MKLNLINLNHFEPKLVYLNKDIVIVVVIKGPEKILRWMVRYCLCVIFQTFVSWACLHMQSKVRSILFIPLAP